MATTTIQNDKIVYITSDTPPIHSRQLMGLQDLARLCGKEIETFYKDLHDRGDIKIDDGNLTDLRLNGRKIEKLPESIAEFKKLKVLEIKNCELTTLPQSIGEMQSLEVLDASHNYIESIPKSVENIKTLRTLAINSNNLSSFGIDLKKLENLTDLYLSQNGGMKFTVKFAQDIIDSESLVHVEAVQNGLDVEKIFIIKFTAIKDSAVIPFEDHHKKYKIVEFGRKRVIF